MRSLFWITIFPVFFTNFSEASDLVEIKPYTNKILMIHYLRPLWWWNPNLALSELGVNARNLPLDKNKWPGNERNFDYRIAPLGGEFAIHQNTVVAAFIFCFIEVKHKPPLEQETLGLTGRSDDRIEQYPIVCKYSSPIKDNLTIESKKGNFKKNRFIHSGMNASGTMDGNSQLLIKLEMKYYNPGVYLMNVNSQPEGVFVKKVNIE